MAEQPENFPSFTEDPLYKDLDAIQRFDVSGFRTKVFDDGNGVGDPRRAATELIDAYRQIGLSTLGSMTSGAKQQLMKFVRQDLDLLQMIASTKVIPWNRNQTSSELSLMRSADQCWADLSPFIVWSCSQFIITGRFKAIVEGSIAETKAKLEATQAQLEATQAEMQKRLDEADAILVDMKQKNERSAVMFTNKAFDEEAKEFQKAGSWWFWASIVMAGLTVAVAVCTIWMPQWFSIPLETPAQSLHFAMSKLVVLTTLVTLLIFAVRNYLASRHNEVVNRHRTNALRTFKALVEAAGTTANHDIILTKAADCIFAAQPTGFAKTDGQDSSPAPAPITISLPTVPGSVFTTAGNSQRPPSAQ